MKKLPQFSPNHIVVSETNALCIYFKRTNYFQRFFVGKRLGRYDDGIKKNKKPIQFAAELIYSPLQSRLSRRNPRR